MPYISSVCLLFTQRLYEVEEWAERYRSRNTGTFPGTGPAIYDNTVYFTDNTYPVMLFNPTYNLFSKQLQGPVTASASNTSSTYREVPHMQRAEINRPGRAGFMFWSVVVSPVEGDVIVWDSAASSVQVRRADDLSLRYNLSVRQSDCITMAADKGHIYMTHYSYGPDGYESFLEGIGPNSKKIYPGTGGTSS